MKTGRLLSLPVWNTTEGWKQLYSYMILISAGSGTRGLVFPKAEPEEQVARDQKQESEQRQQHEPDLFSATYQVKERIVLKQGNGNHISGEF
jgi:hypothetical protein